MKIAGWDSSEVQHKRQRRAVERLLTEATAAADRQRLARKLLRDGNDVVACIVMAAFDAGSAGAEHGAINPLEPLLGGLRVRALRVLRGPSRQQGRDHRQALAMLRHAPKVTDLPLVLGALAAGPEDRVAWSAALGVAAALVPYLAPSEREELRAVLRPVAADPRPEDRDALAIILG